MRSGLLTLVCMGALVWSGFAQDQTGQAKYELIRETINFLATDKAVSQDTNFRISCATLDYECFKQQLSSKPIAGIERWYNSWRSMIAIDKVGLVALRNQVFADIFERPGKGYRKQLAHYEGYISRIERLINPSKDEIPMEQIAIEDTAQTPFISPAELHSTPTEQLTDKDENPKKENTMIAYFAIAIAIIALIIVALPIYKKREQQLPDDFHEQLDELAERMKRLEAKTTDGEIKDAIASLTDIMESVEKRVVGLESRFKANKD